MIKGKGIQEKGQSGGENSYLPNFGILLLPTLDGRQNVTNLLHLPQILSYDTI
jgi:hypothetical protein